MALVTSGREVIDLDIKSVEISESLRVSEDNFAVVSLKNDQLWTELEKFQWSVISSEMFLEANKSALSRLYQSRNENFEQSAKLQNVIDAAKSLSLPL